MLIQQLMTPLPGVLKKEDSLRNAVALFHSSRLDALPVTDCRGKIMGVFTKSGLYEALLAGSSLDDQVSPHIHKEVVVVQPHTPFKEVANQLRSINVGQAVVVDNNRPVGMFTKVDVINALLEQSDSMNLQLQKELQQAGQARYTMDNIISVSSSITALKEKAAKAACTNSTVLLTGESGTGKELFAHAIHNASPRRMKPFIKVNCAAIPENLLESEFFGYEGGAFTGARRGGKPGKFELAGAGTIFLDEIGDMSPGLQSKLLRVLQDKEIERLGGTKPVKVDVRIIAATNQDLGQLVRMGSFRDDLYYRLNVINLDIPPLRERKEDIIPLTHSFNKRYGKILGVPVKEFHDKTLQKLQEYDWPGNIRELENLIERLLNLASGQVIHPGDLPPYINKSRSSDGETQGFMPFQQGVRDAERNLIISALEKSQGNRSRAARILGMSRSNFYKKLSKLGLNC